MRKLSFHPAFVARNGKKLVVVIVARISTEHQDARSLDDQAALVKEYISAQFDGKIEWKIIQSRGSGEYLDTQELAELEGLIESGTVDVVICEDLGRICRRTRAYDICELAIDYSTRVIAINDHVDTAVEGWQMNAYFSVIRHEAYNRDTSARIRRTQRNRFSEGGMVKTVLFCYDKPAGCKSDADLRKNPEMEPIVVGVFERLEQGWSFSRIADWLNFSQVPTGLGSRRKTWDGAMIRRIVFNPILKGERVWNRKKSFRKNRSGRRRQKDAAPEERIVRLVPHLAFIDADRYDRLIADLVRRGEQYSVPKRLGNDPRKGRPRKRTRWPGQHVFCGVCGKMYVYGGHGRTQSLMCGGAREYSCWNGTTFDGPLAAVRISETVFKFISRLRDFDSSTLEMLRDESIQAQKSRNDQLRKSQRDLERMIHEGQHLVEAIKQGGGLAPLLAALKELQTDRRSLEYELGRLKKELPPPIQVPSTATLRSEIRAAFAELAQDSREFADRMRQIIDKIIVFPVQLCDGGNPVLRAQFEVNLTPYLPESYRLPSLEAPMRQEFVVDLFEVPQRAAFREQIMADRAQGLTERTIAGRLNLTITAVQRAAALDRRMRSLGLTDPYVQLTAPLEGNGRCRRHRHERYRRRNDQDDAA